MKVLLESPFAGDVQKNINYARRCMADGIIALIMGLAGTMTEEKDTNESKYNNPDEEVFV